MGYRLSIDDGVNKFYGTKLYGYTDHTDFLSYEYLVEIGKADGTEFYDDGIENEIVLDSEQFKKFISLYNFDLFFNNTMYDIFNLFENTDIQKLVNTKFDKVVSWN